MDNSRGHLGGVIHEFRERTEMSQARLASELSVSVRHVCRVEHGGSLGVAPLRRLEVLMRAAGAPDLALLVRQMLALTGHDAKSLDWRLRQLEHRVAIIEQGRQRGAA